MDIFMPLAIFVIFIILFTLCGWCCKRKREGTVYGYGYGPTVAVTTTTSQTNQSPLVIPPYPVDPRHPTPYSNAPTTGFNTHQPPYPTHATSMPLPPPAGSTFYQPIPPNLAMYPGGFYGGSSGGYPPSGPTPYPPAGPSPYPPAHPAPYPPAAGDYNSNPPPYDVAVSSPPVQPLPTKEGYGKQAPYNPHYN